MTQHIIPAETGLVTFKKKPVMLMCGFDRPLNNMFISILIEPESDCYILFLIITSLMLNDK